MVLIIAISYTLTPYVGPSNEDPILTNEKTGANLTAVMWADPQFSNYLVERTRYFDAACEDVTYNIDGKVDAISSLAREQGCKLLRDNVAELVLEGRTTLDELVKLTFAV